MATDLNKILYFVTIAECGSYTKAAQKLDMPKSTLSRNLSALEDELQVRLINRSTRQLSLTRAGESFFKTSLPLITHLQNAQAEVGDFHDNVKGCLRITMSTEMGIGYISKVLPGFLERYPDIDFEFDFTASNIDLIEEGVDLAIRIGEMDDSSYIAKRLGSPQLSFFASPHYLLANGEPKSLEDLSNHKHIFMMNTQGAIYVKGQAEPFMRENARVVSNSLTFNKGLCLSGQGIAILPETLCMEELQETALIRILSNVELATPNIYLVYPSRKHPSKALTTFMDYLHETIRQFPKLQSFQ